MLLQKHNGTAQCTLAQNCRKNHLQTFAHKKRRTQKCEKICCKYFHIKGKHRNVRKKSASNICTQKKCETQKCRKLSCKPADSLSASCARLVCTNSAKAAAAVAHISLPRLKCAVKVTLSCTMYNGILHVQVATAAAAAHISLPRLKCALTMQCATCLHKSCQNSCCSCCSCTYFTVPA